LAAYPSARPRALENGREGIGFAVITGAAGMLGVDLCRTFGRKHQVIATDITGDAIRMDITDARSIYEVFEEHSPEFVVHAAAYTDVDGCEREMETAYRLNAIGTWNIAAAAREAGAPMAYVSTDFVFDGEKGSPYTEYDAPNPIGCYGASKLAGEIHVRELCPEHYIVRTAWLYGDRGKNFPATILRAAQERKELRVVADQIGSPTYARDLAEFMATLPELGLFGTYHASGGGACSWYEFAVKILELAGMSGVEVKPIKTEEWPSPTRRPKYSVLRNFNLELLGRDNFRPWNEALAEWIQRGTIGRQ